MKIGIAPRTIPDGDASRVAVVTQATKPGRVVLALSIQREAIGSAGIVRNDGPPYVVAEGPRGPVRVADPTRHRAGFLPVVDPRDSHLRRFRSARPDRRVVTITGCGNLLANAGVEARVDGSRVGIPGFMRTGILVEPDGRGRLVSGKRLEAALARDAAARAPDRFVITGPLLVAGGRAAAPDVREFADLRHLLLPAFVEVEPGRRVDFGFDALIRDLRLAARAVAGRPVTLPLATRLPRGNALKARLVETPLDAGALASALLQKGYREAGRAGPPGTFRIRGGEVDIAFLPGIYPHHALALGRGGVVTSVIVTGRSNREGTTIRDLGAALARAGFTDAILLDNGGDVGLLRRKSAGAPLSWAARPVEADRKRAWPLRACLVYHEARARHSARMRA